MITKGSMFLLASGEYSDYSIDGLLIAQQDITEEDLIEAADSGGDTAGNLVEIGMAISANYFEAHIGCDWNSNWTERKTTCHIESYTEFNCDNKEDE